MDRQAIQSSQAIVGLYQAVNNRKVCRSMTIKVFNLIPILRSAMLHEMSPDES